MTIELMTANRAADWLQQRLPKRSAAAWVQWLANNRNTSRPAAFRVPFTKEAGRVWYAVADLQALLTTEQAIESGRSARETTLLHAAETGMLNRPWNGIGRFYGYAGNGEPCVRLGIDAPLMTFKLSLKEAAELIVQIEDAIHNAECIAAEQDPNYQPKLKRRQQAG